MSGGRTGTRTPPGWHELARRARSGSRRSEVPPGWDYNPSAWGDRLPLVGVASVGLLIASYLSLFQFGVFASVWDPFFGRGSESILTSPVSRVLPVPDALLGAIGYLLDAIAGVIGGRARWRRMPWIVLLFGFVVGPLGATSILLVIFQPVLFHAWCTLCLASAAISIGLIGPAADEVLASLQHVKRSVAHGHSFWSTCFGLGAAALDHAPREAPLARPRTAKVAWPQALSAVLGLWLLAAPALLGYGGTASDSDRIVGPIVYAIAFISLAGVARSLLRLNLLPALWLIVSPWAFSFDLTPLLNSLVVGAAIGGLALLALIPSTAPDHFGGGWAALVRSVDRRQQHLTER